MPPKETPRADGDGDGAGNGALDAHPPNNKTLSRPQARSRDSKPETLRKLLIGDLRKLCRHAFGPTLPDNEKGRVALDLLLRLHAGAPQRAEDKMRFEVETRATWMPDAEAADLIDSLLRCDPRRVRPSKEEVKPRVGLTNEQRERLQAWRIPPVDMTGDDLAAQRKVKKKAREAARRRQRGSKPRATYEAESLSSRKPWIAEGVSRRTWYRRRGTSACPTILDKATRTCANPHGKLKGRGASRGKGVCVSAMSETEGQASPSLSPTPASTGHGLVPTPSSNGHGLVSTSQKRRGKKIRANFDAC